MILLIDNYDSFVHNLARYFERLGQETRVVRNDALSVTEVVAMKPRAIVLSPGPCTPTEAGISLELVRQNAEHQPAETAVPLLGICLGHQTIAAALGGIIVRAKQPMHGSASPVFHAGTGLFAGLPNPLVAGRYHSLIVDEVTLPTELDITARTADGVPMALAHRSRPIYGLQFHPESVLTPHGYDLLAAFLRHSGIETTSSRPTFADELISPVNPTAPLPNVPVTF